MEKENIINKKKVIICVSVFILLILLIVMCIFFSKNENQINAMVLNDNVMLYSKPMVNDKKIKQEVKENANVTIIDSVLKDSILWYKVKLDGIWYNVDPTWDCSNIRNGKNPIYCLKTDEEIRKIDKKTDFQGPECNTVVAKKEIDKMFDGKHLFIGNIMIPTAKDMVNSLKQVIEDISDSGRRAYRKAIGMREKILRLFTQKKVESLPHPVENKNSEENKSRPSWDLENWNDFKYTHSIQSDKVQKNGDNLRETIGREDEL